MSYQKFENLPEFLDALTMRELRAVVMRETREVRPTFEGRQVTVGHVHKVVLVAYDRGQVLMVEIPEPNPVEIYGELVTRGLEIRNRRDNIT